MPGAMSNYLESGLLGHIFRSLTFNKPITIGIALCTGTLTEDMGGNLGNLEVANAGSYVRQVLAPSNANWSFSALASPNDSGNVDNLSAITFPQATANWGTVTTVALTDSGVYGSGQLLMFGTLTTAKTVTTGDTFSFSIGDLDIFLS